MFNARPDVWQWTHVPWISAIVHWLSGIAAIVIGFLIPDEGEVFAFRVGFIGLGVLMMLSAFRLPKTYLSVSADKRMLKRTTGPWLKLWCRTEDIPLDDVNRVVLRWRNLARGRRGRGSGTTHEMLMKTSGRREYDLFRRDCLPVNAERCGRTLAEFLGVEFEIDGEEF